MSLDFLWCLSVALQVLWVCQKPLSSLCSLWLPGTQCLPGFFLCSESYEMETSPSGSPPNIWNILCMFRCLFFHKGKATSWAFSPNFSELCRFLFAVLQVLWCFHELLSSFMFSEAPRHTRYAVPHQCSETGETEITPKKSEHWYIFHFSLSLPREKLQVGYFFLIRNRVRLRGRA